MIRAADLIERKRNGEELSDEELAELVLGYARGDVPDYQMAAWCMAVFFRGLSGRETYALTDAMIRSGDTLELGAALGRRSSTSTRRAGWGTRPRSRSARSSPRAASRSGRCPGAGSGTRAGRSTSSSRSRASASSSTIDEFVAQVREIGLAIIGQTADLVPADKKLYALRDVTATVDIVPLIASSIMSKKLAAGADAIVLDVKVGDGAFMKTLDDARILAEQMVELGRRASREVVCLLTDMDQPLGRAVGNALEVREAVDTIARRGPARLQGARPRRVRAPARSLRPGRRPRRGHASARSARSTDGSALEKYERWIRAQGGDPDLDALPRAPVVREVRAPRAGVVTRLAALAIGIAAWSSAAGRRTKERRRSTMPSASSAARSAARRSRRATCSRRSTRGTRTRPTRGRRGRARARTRSATRRHARTASCSTSSPSASDAPSGVCGVSASGLRSAAMPELPEVETFAAPSRRGSRGADRRAEIHDPRLTRPFDLFEVGAELVGERVVAVERRGKYLVVRFESGSVSWFTSG